MGWLLLAGVAGAADTFELSGNLKSFFVAGDGPTWFELSDEAVAFAESAGLTGEEVLAGYGLDGAPFSQGTASGRLLATVRTEHVRVEAHWAAAARTAGVDTGVAGIGTGVGLDAPELLPLSGTAETGAGLVLTHRVDRLVLTVAVPHLDLVVGRQAVSFGSGRVFTPLDLVNPFHPATIDTEYKPGVDALRADVFLGTAGRLTVVGAWAGDPLVGEAARDPDAPVLDELVLAGAGQFLLGVTDVTGFAGIVRGEPVFGAGVVTSVGPVGAHADATLTLAEDPFARVVVGADGRPTGTTSLSGELYLQTLGAAEPSGYLDLAADPRFTRGELWQLGRYYAAVSVAQEITPLVAANLSVITNLGDPSALLVVGGAWSVSDAAEVGFGAYAGLGARPETIPLDLGPYGLIPPDAATLGAAVRSEFGLYPAMGYLQIRTYF